MGNNNRLQWYWVILNRAPTSTYLHSLSTCLHSPSTHLPPTYTYLHSRSTRLHSPSPTSWVFSKWKVLYQASFIDMGFVVSKFLIFFLNFFLSFHTCRGGRFRLLLGGFLAKCGQISLKFWPVMQFKIMDQIRDGFENP